ncbi:hypothetical protein [Roseomonas indoligenes]|uniref:Uncharacterized protein n=1 Tax=Roseomonas indoligenes TaxID=2820811 RepID=A0A940MXZ3_9PROT|nr:hypothetical protein [Pararoseomonas indoligenes]MBP0492879.1 hypothetical protein [Pararoseomonas indoligenes]
MSETSMAADDVDVVEAIPSRTIRFPKLSFAGTDYDHVILSPPSAQSLDEATLKPTGIQTVQHLMRKHGTLPEAVLHLLLPQVIEFADRYFERFKLPVLPVAGDASQGG